MKVTITDTAGTSGATTVEAHDIAETIRPWYPEAPAEVVAAVDDLERAVLRGEDAGALTEYLGVTVEQA